MPPQFENSPGQARWRHYGLTLLETLLVLVLAGIAAQWAISSYISYVDRARVAQAVNDIAMLSTMITAFQRDNGRFPSNLDEIGNGGMRDPWDRSYVYLDLTDNRTRGSSRRDRNLNPLNSDFDLYSVGKDGVTQKQITNQYSLDDVIRANDGAFINLASKYSR